MSYKTILVHLDNSKNLEARIQWAITLAKVEQAHLIGVAPTGISHYAVESPLSAESVGLSSANLSSARKEAKSVSTRFETEMRGSGLSSYEIHEVEDDAFGSLVQRVSYADLLILGQHDAENTRNPLDAGLARDILLSCSGPVLLVPREEAGAKHERRILIAWNGSIEARRAVRDALPLLQYAKAVNVVVFSPTGQDSESGACLNTYLRRHGIGAGLLNQPATYRDIHKVLWSTVADTQSDLLVMGGYGHSPFYEAILGGVTRAVLRAMPVPVLMSH